MKTDKNNRIDIAKIHNVNEKNILSFLHTHGRCIYGDIIKKLKISNVKGQKAISSLLNKGFIRHQDKSSYIELNVEIKE